MLSVPVVGSYWPPFLLFCSTFHFSIATFFYIIFSKDPKDENNKEEQHDVTIEDAAEDLKETEDTKKTEKKSFFSKFKFPGIKKKEAAEDTEPLQKEEEDDEEEKEK